MSPQLTVEVEGFPALLAHRVLGLLVHLVDVLTEVRVFLLTDLTLQLKLHVDSSQDIIYNIEIWTSLSLVYKVKNISFAGSVGLMRYDDYRL